MTVTVPLEEGSLLAAALAAFMEIRRLGRERDSHYREMRAE